VSICYLRPFFHHPLINYPSVVGTGSLPFPRNMCLFDLTALRTLKIRTSVPGYSLFPDLPCDLLPLFSTQSRTLATIETICLDFYFTNVLDVDDLQHPESITERPGIDAVSTGGLYPRLKTVKVRYLFRSQDYWRWLVTEVVHQVFPQISASEGIKLGISSEPLLMAIISMNCNGV